MPPSAGSAVPCLWPASLRPAAYSQLSLARLVQDPGAAGEGSWCVSLVIREAEVTDLYQDSGGDICPTSLRIVHFPVFWYQHPDSVVGDHFSLTSVHVSGLRGEKGDAIISLEADM